MKRFKEYNPNQNYLIALVPGKTFPLDGFEYFIVQMMDEIVKEEDFYLEKIDKGGSEAHNPKAILGILFYAYSKGVYSFRKMAWNCQYNTAFIYISGYTTSAAYPSSELANDQGLIIVQLAALYKNLMNK